MGMYTGLRFKGIIKKQYRREISIMFNKGDWESCETPILKDFLKNQEVHGFLLDQAVIICLILGLKMMMVLNVILMKAVDGSLLPVL